MDKGNIQSNTDNDKLPEYVDTSAVLYDLLFVTQAYNRKEITFEEWVRQSREWAKRIIEQHDGG